MDKKNCKEYFGERLKLLRNSEGLSQQELAAKLGVSKGSLGFYETCKNTPDIEFLDRTARYFNVSIDYLLGRSEVKTDKKTDTKAVCDYLGISEKAVSDITRLKDEPRLNETLNSLLELGLISYITTLTALIHSSKKLIVGYENLAFINLQKGKVPSDTEKVEVLCCKLTISDARNKLTEMLLKVVDNVTSYSAATEELCKECIDNFSEFKEVETYTAKMLGSLPLTDEDNETIMRILYGETNSKNKDDKKDGDPNG